MQPWQGERTRNFRNRDLNCSDLSNADLRRVDLTGASMSGAELKEIDFQGASLDHARLQGADLFVARLRGASLSRAQLQGASLFGARLQGASLMGTDLQGASLIGAALQGASLDHAQLQGAFLFFAQLQGADLQYASLDGAILNGAMLQGASLFTTRLRGASLSVAQLQGADLDYPDMNHSVLSDVWIWRAKKPNCMTARVTNHKADAVIEVRGLLTGLLSGVPVPATPDAIAEFIERSVADIPDAKQREAVATRMRKNFVADSEKDDTARAWSRCEEEAAKVSQEKFDEEHATLLRDLVCDARDNRWAIAGGIAINWISDSDERQAFSAQLARGLLGQDGKECPATKDFLKMTKEKLLAAVARGRPASAQPK